MDANGFDDLLDRYQTGEAAPAEIAELQRLLRDDADKRRRFVEHSLLEVQLRKACAGILPTELPAPAKASRFPRFALALTTMAAAVLLALGMIHWLAADSTSPAIVMKGRITQDQREEPNIAIGKPFEVLGNDPAVVQLSDGSRAEFDPETKATIHENEIGSRQVVKLQHGGGTFKVVHADGNFRVDTPVGSVTALGTEFSVKLRRQAKSKIGGDAKLVLTVTVTDGSVGVDVGGRREIVTAGNNRKFGDDGPQHNKDDGNQNNRNDGNKQNGQSRTGQR